MRLCNRYGSSREHVVRQVRSLSTHADINCLPLPIRTVPSVALPVKPFIDISRPCVGILVLESVQSDKSAVVATGLYKSLAFAYLHPLFGLAGYEALLRNIDAVLLKL